MTTTPNGWTASPNPADFGGLDNREVPGAPGVHLAPGVRAGAVATVLFDFAAKFHAHVEPLRAGQCWGYAYRPDTNARSVLSEHAAAVAIDLNAPEHPNGRRGTFTDAQVGVLRALLAGYGGHLYWGGDFAGTDDEMHVEVHGTLAQIEALAATLTAHPAPAPAPAHEPAAEHPAPAGHAAHVIGPHEGNTAQHAPAPLLDPDGPEPGFPPVGHDATGSGASFRAQYGNEGINIGRMQAALNNFAPDYAHLEVDNVYGEETAAVIEDFQRRIAASDPKCPHADKEALAAGNGDTVGPATARAFARVGIHL